MGKPSRSGYHPVSLDELGPPPKDDKTTSRWHSPSVLLQRPGIYCTLLAITTVAAILSTTLLIFEDLLLKPAPYSPYLSHPTDCGSSVAEAREAGCRFDVMSFCWVPPACFDEDLTAQFLSLEPWVWHRGPGNASETVGLEEVQRGENEFLYVDWHYHRLHCSYMWRKLHRALLDQRPLDTYIGNYTHTAHCEHVLTEMVEMKDEDVGVRISQKFVGCGFDQDGEGRELYRQRHDSTIIN